MIYYNSLHCGNWFLNLCYKKSFVSTDKYNKFVVYLYYFYYLFLYIKIF